VSVGKVYRNGETVCLPESVKQENCEKPGNVDIG